MARLSLETPPRFDPAEPALEFDLFLRRDGGYQALNLVGWLGSTLEKNLKYSSHLTGFRQQRRLALRDTAASGISQ